MQLNTFTTKFHTRQQEFTLPHSVRNVPYNLTKYSNIELDDLTDITRILPKSYRKLADSVHPGEGTSNGQFNRNICINKLVRSKRSAN